MACPKCKGIVVTSVLVAYACYDAPDLSREQKKCLSCGHVWFEEE